MNVTIPSEKSFYPRDNISQKKTIKLDFLTCAGKSGMSAFFVLTL